MKIIMGWVVFVSLLFSVTNDDLSNKDVYTLFKNNYYTYLCDNRWKYINMYTKKREDLLSLVAYACIKKGFLVPALDLAKVLNYTKEGRKNATYIVTLYLMKKIILQKINGDKLNISAIKLPKIKDNTLGIVFNNIQKGTYTLNNKEITIFAKGKKYLVKTDNDYNLIIFTYGGNVMLKREKFW